MEDLIWEKEGSITKLSPGINKGKNPKSKAKQAIDKEFPEEELPISMKGIMHAKKNLHGTINTTPLQYHSGLSLKFGAKVFIKREDLQVVRSYKIRGAFNKMISLNPSILRKGVVCASAGNHSQGFAFACKRLEVLGKIFMPKTTPNQKIQQARNIGGDFVEIILGGDSFDDAYLTASRYATENDLTFIHPFDDPKIIEGQATVGLEIIDQIDSGIDFLFAPVGGGGLMAGIAHVFANLSPRTHLIGIEPEGAPAMQYSLKNQKRITLSDIDRFVDGAAVKRVGAINFEIFSRYKLQVETVPEGRICSLILKLYNEEAIVAEPAGVLALAALEDFAEQIKGKTVVCILSGGNNDIIRMDEIRERSMLYEGLKHYFLINFPQRAGALREFLEKVLGKEDDIVHFAYSKKNSRERVSALVGLELKHKLDLENLFAKLKEYHISFEYLNHKQEMLQFLL